MSFTSRIGRASEVTADGPLVGLPGNASQQFTLAQVAAGQVVHTPGLPVNQASTAHFVVPFNAEIVGGLMRTLTQQTTANGSVVIERNGTNIGSLTVETTETAGTIKAITVGSGGTISSANARLTAGDVITFSRPNTGAAGVVSIGLMLIPRA